MDIRSAHPADIGLLMGLDALIVGMLGVDEPIKDGVAARFEVECPRCAYIIPLAILREENVIVNDEGDGIDSDTRD